MTTYEIIKSLANSQSLYEYAFFTAKWLLPVGGLLLMLSVHLRIVETQLSSHSGLGVWGATIKSIIGWTVIYLMYFSIGALIIDFHNGFIDFMDKTISPDTVYKNIDQYTAQFEKKMADAEKGGRAENVLTLFKDIGANSAGLLAFLPVKFLFYIAHSISIIVTILGNFIHAFIFCIVYLLGMIFIPLAISQNLSFMNVWKTGCFFIFIWPVVNLVTTAAINLPLRDILDKTMASAAVDRSSLFMEMADYYSAMTILLGINVVMQALAFLLSIYIAVNANSGAEAMLRPLINVMRRR